MGEKTGDYQVGLMIAVPTLGRPVSLAWAFAFGSHRPPINYKVRTGSIWGRPIDEARNRLAKEAVDQGCKYIFFLGDDVIAPGHTLRQLIYQMEHNPKIGVIGGVYCAKSHPTFPLVFRGNGIGSYWDWTTGEAFPVTGIGMDCTLVRTDVFRQLSDPWFETVDKDEYLDGKPNVETWTEDLKFCDKVALETDWEIWVDTMVICEHWAFIGGNQWEKFTLRKDAHPMLLKDLGKQKRILDVGCGEPPAHWDFRGEGAVVRVDARDECGPTYRCDVRKLPFNNDYFHVVFSSHTLEHFSREEIDEVLDEWIRVLMPGGELRLIVPTIEWAAEQIMEGEVNDHVLNVLYGAQTYDLNFHKMGFTPRSLKKILKGRGLRILEMKRDKGYNLICSAEKPGGKRKKKKSLKERRAELKALADNLERAGYHREGKTRPPLCCQGEMRSYHLWGEKKPKGWICPKCRKRREIE